MAIRYSGDVEIRIRYVQGTYHGSVRSPGFRGRGSVPRSKVGGASPTSPESYDRAAKVILREAEDAARAAGMRLHTTGKGRGIEVRRTFQSPCPYRT